ncbi:putative Structural maintenance of chromosomes protein 3 [Blattamonas nauphoetae]|uniref:Structural maintenance of chromosomes protein 3 n=1 Tax=Blattamonas nauphoetae TaxID=2049346 RepID=A0ABQ9YM24_9EUKA|nr:putative Structural maintenance of chromosomes protein 3 [Blattamonas nauphoetae]
MWSHESDYHIIKPIGEGSFGRVYQGRKKGTGILLALKYISTQTRKRKDRSKLRMEVEVLQQLKHENIIKFVDFFETEIDFVIVTEFAQDDLSTLLLSDQRFSESEIQWVTRQLVSALKYLHDRNIIHRDLKPQNILIDATGTIKICDFGFARILDQKTSKMGSIKGTPLYMAPEIAFETKYDWRSDLWSLGALLYELHAGHPPFESDNFVSLLRQLTNNEVTYPSTMSPRYTSFLRGLLQKDPNNRFGWSELLNHPFLTEIDDVDQNLTKFRTNAKLTPSPHDLEDYVPTVHHLIQLREPATTKQQDKILTKKRDALLEFLQEKTKNPTARRPPTALTTGLTQQSSTSTVGLIHQPFLPDTDAPIPISDDMIRNLLDDSIDGYDLRDFDRRPNMGSSLRKITSSRKNLHNDALDIHPLTVDSISAQPITSPTVPVHTVSKSPVALSTKDVPLSSPKTPEIDDTTPHKSKKGKGKTVSSKKATPEATLKRTKSQLNIEKDQTPKKIVQTKAKPSSPIKTHKRKSTQVQFVEPTPKPDIPAQQITPLGISLSLPRSSIHTSSSHLILPPDLSGTHTPDSQAMETLLLDVVPSLDYFASIEKEDGKIDVPVQKTVTLPRSSVRPVLRLEIPNSSVDMSRHNVRPSQRSSNSQGQSKANPTTSNISHLSHVRSDSRKKLSDSVDHTQLNRNSSVLQHDLSAHDIHRPISRSVSSLADLHAQFQKNRQATGAPSSDAPPQNTMPVTTILEDDSVAPSKTTSHHRRKVKHIAASPSNLSFVVFTKDPHANGSNLLTRRESFTGSFISIAKRTERAQVLSIMKLHAGRGSFIVDDSLFVCRKPMKRTQNDAVQSVPEENLMTKSAPMRLFRKKNVETPIGKDEWSEDSDFETEEEEEVEDEEEAADESAESSIAEIPVADSIPFDIRRGDSDDSDFGHVSPASDKAGEDAVKTADEGKEEDANPFGYMYEEEGSDEPPLLDSAKNESDINEPAPDGEAIQTEDSNRTALPAIKVFEPILLVSEQRTLNQPNLKKTPTRKPKDHRKSKIRRQESPRRWGDALTPFTPKRGAKETRTPQLRSMNIRPSQKTLTDSITRLILPPTLLPKELLVLTHRLLNGTDDSIDQGSGRTQPKNKNSLVVFDQNQQLWGTQRSLGKDINTQFSTHNQVSSTQGERIVQLLTAMDAVLEHPGLVFNDVFLIATLIHTLLLRMGIVACTPAYFSRPSPIPLFPPAPNLIPLIMYQKSHTQEEAQQTVVEKIKPSEEGSRQSQTPKKNRDPSKSTTKQEQLRIRPSQISTIYPHLSTYEDKISYAGYPRIPIWTEAPYFSTPLPPFASLQHPDISIFLTDIPLQANRVPYTTAPPLFVSINQTSLVYQQPPYELSFTTVHQKSEHELPPIPSWLAMRWGVYRWLALKDAVQVYVKIATRTALWAARIEVPPLSKQLKLPPLAIDTLFQIAREEVIINKDHVPEHSQSVSTPGTILHRSDESRSTLTLIRFDAFAEPLPVPKQQVDLTRIVQGIVDIDWFGTAKLYLTAVRGLTDLVRSFSAAARGMYSSIVGSFWNGTFQPHWVYGSSDHDQSSMTFFEEDMWILSFIRGVQPFFANFFTCPQHQVDESESHGSNHGFSDRGSLMSLETFEFDMEKRSCLLRWHHVLSMAFPLTAYCPHCSVLPRNSPVHIYFASSCIHHHLTNVHRSNPTTFISPIPTPPHMKPKTSNIPFGIVPSEEVVTREYSQLCEQLQNASLECVGSILESLQSISLLSNLSSHATDIFHKHILMQTSLTHDKATDPIPNRRMSVSSSRGASSLANEAQTIKSTKSKLTQLAQGRKGSFGSNELEDGDFGNTSSKAPGHESMSSNTINVFQAISRDLVMCIGQCLFGGTRRWGSTITNETQICPLHGVGICTCEDPWKLTLRRTTTPVPLTSYQQHLDAINKRFLKESKNTITPVAMKSQSAKPEEPPMTPSSGFQVMMVEDNEVGPKDQLTIVTASPSYSAVFPHSGTLVASTSARPSVKERPKLLANQTKSMQEHEMTFQNAPFVSTTPSKELTTNLQFLNGVVVSFFTFILFPAFSPLADDPTLIFAGEARTVWEHEKIQTTKSKKDKASTTTNSTEGANLQNESVSSHLGSLSLARTIATWSDENPILSHFLHGQSNQSSHQPTHSKSASSLISLVNNELFSAKFMKPPPIEKLKKNAPDGLQYLRLTEIDDALVSHPGDKDYPLLPPLLSLFFESFSETLDVVRASNASSPETSLVHHTLTANLRMMLWILRTSDPNSFMYHIDASSINSKDIKLIDMLAAMMLFPESFVKARRRSRSGILSNTLLTYYLLDSAAIESFQQAARPTNLIDSSMPILHPISPQLSLLKPPQIETQPLLSDGKTPNTPFISNLIGVLDLEFENASVCPHLSNDASFGTSAPIQTTSNVQPDKAKKKGNHVWRGMLSMETHISLIVTLESFIAEIVSGGLWQPYMLLDSILDTNQNPQFTDDRAGVLGHHGAHTMDSDSTGKTGILARQVGRGSKPIISVAIAQLRFYVFRLSGNVHLSSPFIPFDGIIETDDRQLKERLDTPSQPGSHVRTGLVHFEETGEEATTHPSFSNTEPSTPQATHELSMFNLPAHIMRINSLFNHITPSSYPITPQATLSVYMQKASKVKKDAINIITSLVKQPVIWKLRQTINLFSEDKTRLVVQPTSCENYFPTEDQSKQLSEYALLLPFWEMDKSAVQVVKRLFSHRQPTKKFPSPADTDFVFFHDVPFPVALSHCGEMFERRCARASFETTSSSLSGVLFQHHQSLVSGLLCSFFTFSEAMCMSGSDGNGLCETEHSDVTYPTYSPSAQSNPLLTVLPSKQPMFQLNLPDSTQILNKQITGTSLSGGLLSCQQIDQAWWNQTVPRLFSEETIRTPPNFSDPDVEQNENEKALALEKEDEVYMAQYSASLHAVSERTQKKPSIFTTTQASHPTFFQIWSPSMNMFPVKALKDALDKLDPEVEQMKAKKGTSENQFMDASSVLLIQSEMLSFYQFLSTSPGLCEMAKTEIDRVSNVVVKATPFLTILPLLVSIPPVQTSPFLFKVTEPQPSAKLDFKTRSKMTRPLPHETASKAQSLTDTFGISYLNRFIAPPTILQALPALNKNFIASDQKIGLNPLGPYSIIQEFSVGKRNTLVSSCVLSTTPAAQQASRPPGFPTALSPNANPIWLVDLLVWLSHVLSSPPSIRYGFGGVSPMTMRDSIASGLGFSPIQYALSFLQRISREILQLFQIFDLEQPPSKINTDVHRIQPPKSRHTSKPSLHVSHHHSTSSRRKNLATSDSASSHRVFPRAGFDRVFFELIHPMPTVRPLFSSNMHTMTTHFTTVLGSQFPHKIFNAPNPIPISSSDQILIDQSNLNPKIVVKSPSMLPGLETMEKSPFKFHLTLFIFLLNCHTVWDSLVTLSDPYILAIPPSPHTFSVAPPLISQTLQSQQVALSYISQYQVSLGGAHIDKPGFNRTFMTSSNSLVSTFISALHSSKFEMFSPRMMYQVLFIMDNVFAATKHLTVYRLKLTSSIDPYKTLQNDSQQTSLTPMFNPRSEGPSSLFGSPQTLTPRAASPFLTGQSQMNTNSTNSKLKIVYDVADPLWNAAFVFINRSSRTICNTLFPFASEVLFESILQWQPSNKLLSIWKPLHQQIVDENRYLAPVIYALSVSSSMHPLMLIDQLELTDAVATLFTTNRTTRRTSRTYSASRTMRHSNSLITTQNSLRLFKQNHSLLDYSTTKNMITSSILPRYINTTEDERGFFLNRQWMSFHPPSFQFTYDFVLAIPFELQSFQQTAQSGNSTVTISVDEPNGTKQVVMNLVHLKGTLQVPGVMTLSQFETLDCLISLTRRVVLLRAGTMGGLKDSLVGWIVFLSSLLLSATTPSYCLIPPYDLAAPPIDPVFAVSKFTKNLSPSHSMTSSPGKVSPQQGQTSSPVSGSVTQFTFNTTVDEKEQNHVSASFYSHYAVPVPALGCTTSPLSMAPPPFVIIYRISNVLASVLFILNQLCVTTPSMRKEIASIPCIASLLITLSSILSPSPTVSYSLTELPFKSVPLRSAAFALLCTLSSNSPALREYCENLFTSIELTSRLFSMGLYQREMRIKTVKITGFRSYKEQTEFSEMTPGINVIAIRFVLGEETGSQGADGYATDRHIGIADQAAIYSVEVVFDNSDERFPNGGAEVRIKRQKSATADEFFVDNRKAQKTDVLTLLDNAGFSPNNPYFMIRQGKIQDIASMNDAQRFQLIKEIAGTHVYEERRNQSKKLLDEDDRRLKSIDEQLVHLTSRLQELNIETQELREYEENDRRCRVLEGCIVEKELGDVKQKMENVDEIYNQSLKRVANMTAKLVEDTSARKKAEDLMESNQTTIETHVNHVETLISSAADIEQMRSTLEIQIEEIEDNRKNGAEKMNSHMQEKAELLKKQKEAEDDIFRLGEELSQLSLTEATQRAQLEEREQRLKLKYAKGTQENRFRTKKARDEWIDGELKKLKQEKIDHEKEIRKMESSKEENTEELRKTERAIQKEKENLEQIARSEGSLSMDTIASTRSELEKVMTARKELWRAENDTKNGLEQLSVEHDKRRIITERKMGRASLAAHEAVRQFAAAEHMTDVYGPVASVISVDERDRTAIEVIGGGSLFHILVGTPATASRLIAHLKQKNMGGLTFIPLTGVRGGAINLPKDAKSIPDCSIASKLVKCDEKFRNAIEVIWGRVVVVNQIETASMMAKTFNIDSCTRDGKRVGRKGALSGGYFNEDLSVLKAMEDIKAIEMLRLDGLERQSKIQADLKVVEEQFLELTKKERDEHDRMQREMKEKDLATNKLRMLEVEREYWEGEVNARERRLAKLRERLTVIDVQEKEYETEKTRPFSIQISEEEREEMVQLNTEIPSLRTALIATMDEIGTKKLRRTELGMKVRREYGDRLDEIERELNRIAGMGIGANNSQSSQKDAINVRLTELKAEVKKLQADSKSKLETRKTVEQTIEKLQKEQDKLREDVDHYTTEIETMSRNLEVEQARTERLLTQRETLSQQIEEHQRRMRELGSVGSADTARYAGMKTNDIAKELKDAQRKLRQYSKVNKKALELQENVKQQKEEMEGRRKELVDGLGAIHRLIDDLDEKKERAVSETLQTVQTHFTDIFATLTTDPTGTSTAKGTGVLSIVRQGDNARNPITGISCKVTFVENGEPKTMPELSGGQKTISALALIFAIQRTDPAPFYLLDEVDAALDDKNVMSLSLYLQALSSQQVQIVMTTFKERMAEVGNTFYGVQIEGQVSRILSISQSQAVDFLRSGARTTFPDERLQEDQTRKQRRLHVDGRAGLPPRRSLSENDDDDDIPEPLNY